MSTASAPRNCVSWHTFWPWAKTRCGYKVPGPIALLQAKIANVVDLKQNCRQDARHVIILTRLLPP